MNSQGRSRTASVSRVRISSFRTVSLVMVLLCLCPCLAFSQEYARIAGFNIAEFGEGNHPQTRELSVIAAMLVERDLDLIAIQEIGVTPQGETQVNALQTEMNSLLPSGSPQYVSFVTPRSGDERCAFIYRYPIIKEDEVLWLDDDKDPTYPAAGGEIYYRVPVAVSFRANEFDFVIVSLHLAWGDLERRKKEVAALRRFLWDESGDEQDWIVIGDMNRYGKYKVSEKKAFDKLLKGKWKNKYRFPLLEAITDPDDMKVRFASRDEYSTTVAKSKNIYDQIIISKGAFPEFDADAPAFGEHVGIVAFDREEPYASITDHNAVKYRVSDHRPIWARFRIDLPDDD